MYSIKGAFYKALPPVVDISHGNLPQDHIEALLYLLVIQRWFSDAQCSPLSNVKYILCSYTLCLRRSCAASQWFKFNCKTLTNPHISTSVGPPDSMRTYVLPWYASSHLPDRTYSEGIEDRDHKFWHGDLAPHLKQSFGPVANCDSFSLNHQTPST